LAVFGTAIGVFLWIAFGTDGAFAGMIIDVMSKRIVGKDIAQSSYTLNHARLLLMHSVAQQIYIGLGKNDLGVGVLDYQQGDTHARQTSS
jgi:hypothetical protein